MEFTKNYQLTDEDWLFIAENNMSDESVTIEDTDWNIEWK